MQACIPALAAFAETHASAAGAWRSLARAKAAVGADEDACAIFARAVATRAEDDELRAEYWAQLSHAKQFDDVIRDAAAHHPTSRSATGSSAGTRPRRCAVSAR